MGVCVRVCACVCVCVLGGGRGGKLAMAHYYKPYLGQGVHIPLQAFPQIAGRAAIVHQDDFTQQLSMEQSE